MEAVHNSATVLYSWRRISKRQS